MKGKITCYLDSKQLGYILGEDNKTYAFTKNDLTNYSQGLLDNLEVEFNEDLNPSGYIATNIKLLSTPNSQQSKFNQNNFKKQNFNSNININEYELLEGIYLSKNYDFLDGELIYISSYEISTSSDYSTEDALNTLKNTAVNLGFNALINLEMDTEIEFSLSNSTSQGTISPNAFGSSYSMSSVSSGFSKDYKKHSVKARLGLIGIKSNTPSNINLDEINKNFEVFNKVSLITNDFYKHCYTYLGTIHIVRVRKIFGILLSFIALIIFFAMITRTGFLALPLIFLLPILVIAIIAYEIHSLITRKKYRKILEEDVQIYKQLKNLLSEEAYYYMYANADNIRITKIGA